MSEDPRTRDLHPDTDAGLDATDVLPPTQMVGGKYKLGRLIGEGGMGAVYEAEHTGLEKRVAVKLLNEVFITDTAATKRFEREAKAAAAIRHSCIVEVTDTGADEDGIPFIVMELLEGESLSAIIRREKILSPVVAATITRQILSGLAAAHEKNVIHRDLKPGNIFMARREDGACQVKILDFGISKFFSDGIVQDVTATGAVIGTPRFMAPEQARGEASLDGRVDIYAAGVLLYRMVTGKLPFAAKTHDEVIKLILDGKAVPPRHIRDDIPAALERVILKAMATDRNKRYADAEAFSTDLLRAMPEAEGRTVQFMSPANVASTATAEGSYLLMTGQRSQQTIARSTTLRWLLPLILLTVILGIGGLYLMLLRPAQIPRVAADASTPTPLAGEPINVGITRYLPREQLIREHSALISYLQRRLQRPVMLKVREDYIDLSAQLEAGNLDLAALSSYAYIQAKRRLPGIKLLATHVTDSGTSYQGYIIARASSDIQDLDHLKGKVFCYVSPTSTSGYLYPRAILRQRGIDPDKDFKATRFTGDHLSALKALESGACDGAAVFAGIYLEAERHGVSPKKHNVLATTARIHYDAYCAPPNLPDELTHSLREALLALKPGSELTKRVLGRHSRILGFVDAKDSDWDGVRRMEKYLDQPPKKAPK